MNLRDLAGIPLGLVAGAAMSVAVSCAWAVLHLPARLQDMFQAGSPRLFSLALLLGLLGASLGADPRADPDAAGLGGEPGGAIGRGVCGHAGQRPGKNPGGGPGAAPALSHHG